MYDMLKRSGVSLTVVIDNMMTSLMVDLLMDFSLFQSQVYKFISCHSDLQQAQINRFLLDMVSGEGIVVRQKFLKLLMTFQPSLLSSVLATAGPGKVCHHGNNKWRWCMYDWVKGEPCLLHWWCSKSSLPSAIAPPWLIDEGIVQLLDLSLRHTAAYETAIG